MKYSKFLKDNDTIGVTAMSAGLGNSIDEFEKSLRNIRSYGFNVIETNNVRVASYVSGSGEDRANELKTTAKPGSLSAKANMVRDYNERNSRK